MVKDIKYARKDCKPTILSSITANHAYMAENLPALYMANSQYSVVENSSSYLRCTLQTPYFLQYHFM